MNTIKKEVKLGKDSKIKVVVDSGFACGGNVEIAYFNSESNELETLETAALEDGVIEAIVPPFKQKTRIAVFGMLTPLPGKESVRINAWLYEDNLIVEAIRVEEPNFSIQFIVETIG